MINLCSGAYLRLEIKEGSSDNKYRLFVQIGHEKEVGLFMDRKRQKRIGQGGLEHGCLRSLGVYTPMYFQHPRPTVKEAEFGSYREVTELYFVIGKY